MSFRTWITRQAPETKTAFNPSSFYGMAYVQFGYGMHKCPAEKYAMTVLTSFFSVLVRTRSVELKVSTQISLAKLLLRSTRTLITVFLSAMCAGQQAAAASVPGHVWHRHAHRRHPDPATALCHPPRAHVRGGRARGDSLHPAPRSLNNTSLAAHSPTRHDATRHDTRTIKEHEAHIGCRRYRCLA
jgi:hypothetical protein